MQNTEELTDWIDREQPRHIEELKELLRIPGVSARSEHNDDTRRSAQWVQARLAELDFDTELHETKGHPIVTGSRVEDPSLPTVLIYGHYDVQPPEPLDEWTTPPFDPTIRDGRIYARGATDDKGQFYAHIKAVEAHVRTAGKLPVNVKFLIEGEEEVGSPNLRPFLESHRDQLEADVVMVSDSPMPAPGVPGVTVSLRGLAYVEVEVRGASHDLHSGLYGGAAPNPIHALSELIAGLHDETGRITIDGFYDDVRELTDDERTEISRAPFDDAEWLRTLGIKSAIGEESYSIQERVAIRPTLDCNGIYGGYTGQGAKTVIAARANAKISCRLVPNQSPERISELLQAHFEKHVPRGYTVRVSLHHGGRPSVASTDSPAMEAAMEALTQTWNEEAVYTRGGGSIPIVADFKEVLGLDTILMGLGLEDDRLHSPNEKFDIINFRNGIEASARFLGIFGQR